MPTTITRSIGSGGGRDYSTIQAWIDDCPANLVTADQIWRGEMYNDSEFTAATTFPSITTDATRYVELTAAAGQAFQDHGSVRTNALRYNQANGVGINISSGFVDAITFGTAFTRISRLQIKTTSGFSIGAALAASLVLKDLLIEYSGHGYGSARSIEIDSGTIANVVGILRSGANAGIAHSFNNATYVGCTAVRLTTFTATGTAFTTAYGANVMRSCAIFGFTTSHSGGSWSGGNNATNLASGLPGSSNQHSVSYTSTTPFTQASDTNPDLRAISGTSLAGNGFLDSTNAPNDISALSRAASPTIGAWELAAVGGTELLTHLSGMRH